MLNANIQEINLKPVGERPGGRQGGPSMVKNMMILDSVSETREERKGRI